MLKHFIDTSVLRQLVASTKATKDYYDACFDQDSIYVAQYARMEYTRGFILNCMQFYGKLSMPSTTGYYDALQLWSNMPQSRAVKAVMTLASSIGYELEKGRLQRFSKDLDFQKKHLGDYIRRLFLSPELYKNPGVDNNLCSRVKYKLKYDPLSVNECFIVFIEQFKDANNCKTCKMDTFIKNKNSTILKIIKHSAQGHRPEGFNAIKEALTNISSGKHRITCTRCSKIGDSIIAMIAPDNFNIECVDNSFDDLALALNKSHTKHESELARSKRLNT